jgi:mannose-6-phosphate isomerase-like protein (cupin superfamily)
MSIRSKNTVSLRVWGDACSAWDLLKDENLSVSLEEMPPGTAEIEHRHARSQQFFFVLSGQLSINLDDRQHVLREQEGLSVPPNTSHKARNSHSETVRFLVISCPSTTGDRIVSAS